jgi:hypothetical protein
MISSPAQMRNSAPLWLAFAVPGGIVLAIIVLFAISVPGGAGKRLAEIEAKATAAAQAAGADGNLKTFPAGSVCSGDFNDALKAQLNSALAATGLKIESFDVGNTGQAATLQAYHLAFKGTGSYEDALAALNVLRGYRPKIFADTVALHNHVSDVELEVDGRLFCR